jgi:cytochrome b
LSKRERQILSGIECGLGRDRRLERCLRTWRIGGLRGVEDSVWAMAVLTAVLVAVAVAAVVVASSGKRTALVLPALVAGTAAVLAAVRWCELRRGRRLG